MRKPQQKPADTDTKTEIRKIFNKTFYLRFKNCWSVAEHEVVERDKD